MLLRSSSSPDPSHLPVPTPPDIPTTTTHVPSMANHETLIPIALAYFVILNVTLILLLVRIINWFLCLPPAFHCDP